MPCKTIAYVHYDISGAFLTGKESYSYRKVLKKTCIKFRKVHQIFNWIDSTAHKI